MGSLTIKDLENGIRGDALAVLRARFGDDVARRAAGDVALAFSASIGAAKNPDAYLVIADTAQGRASIINCIAISALTQLNPGGPNPKCWLIPKGGKLQWWISHQGICTLARRAGYQITPVLVHKDDTWATNLGVLTEHQQKAYVRGFADLAGAYLRVVRMSDGYVFEPVWLHGQALIKTATNGDPWKDHPAEMLMKAAIKYSAARGFLPIESLELNAALEADTDAETVEPTATRTAGSARAAAGLPPKVIEDRQGMDAPPDFAGEEAALAERVPVTTAAGDDIPF